MPRPRTRGRVRTKAVRHLGEDLRLTIVASIMRGMSINEAARTFGVPAPNIVEMMQKLDDQRRSLRREQAQLLASRKDLLAERLLRLVHASLDRAAATVADANYKDAVVGAAILLDKYARLQGEPGETVEVRVQHSIKSLAEELASTVQALRSGHQQLPSGDVIDVEPAATDR